MMTERRKSGPQRISGTIRVNALVALSFAALVTAGCSASVNAPAENTRIAPDGVTSKRSGQSQDQSARIAMLLPLGGFDRSAMLAKSMKQAGELALFELDRPLVQLIVKDDRGTLEGAAAAAKEAVAEGAEIIIGPLLPQSVAGAANVARASKISMIALSNDARLAGNGVFVMNVLMQQEVDRIVSFAASQGKRRFAALIPADDTGKATETAFHQAVNRAGGTVVALETYPLQANAMLGPVKNLFETIKGEQPIDALFVPGGPEQMQHLGPLLTYSGLDPARVKLLGTSSWDNPGLGRDKVFLGGWFPGPDPQGFQDFSQRFTRTFGTPPPRSATFAYDAVALAVRLTDEPAAQRYTPTSLMRPSGFFGVDGPVKFMATGVAERGLAVLEVQPFGSSVIDQVVTASR